MSHTTPRRNYPVYDTLDQRGEVKDILKGALEEFKKDIMTVMPPMSDADVTAIL